MAKLSSILFLIFSITLNAQQSNILLEGYTPYTTILSEMDSMGEQYAAWKLSRIGRYNEAKEVFENSRSIEFPEPKKQQTDFDLEDPFFFIDSISKDSRAIFINEAHHVSQHRNFVRHLLPVLYRNGFKYFGMEALNAQDTTLVARGYPVKNTGFYTKDPVYGELIQDAIDLGFSPFGYEAKSGSDGKEREIQQANNIAGIMLKDTLAKILVLAGFDHIREDSLMPRWGKAMAGRFMEITGIDPITIDQTQFGSTFFPENTNPILKNLDFEGYQMAVGRKEKFTNPYSSKSFDYYIFYRDTFSKDGIPEWKHSFGRKPYHIQLGSLHVDDGFLVLAYDFGEYLKEGESTVNLIPKDIVSPDKNTMKPLLLGKGKYYIEVVDADGHVQHSETMYCE